MKLTIVAYAAGVLILVALGIATESHRKACEKHGGRLVAGAGLRFAPACVKAIEDNWP